MAAVVDAEDEGRDRTWNVDRLVVALVPKEAVRHPGSVDVEPATCRRSLILNAAVTWEPGTLRSTNRPLFVRRKPVVVKPSVSL